METEMAKAFVRTNLIGAICVVVLLAYRPAVAQTGNAHGWPGGVEPVRVTVVTAKPAPKTKPAPAPAAAPLEPATGLPQLLQQQSELLARLMLELEAYKAAMLNQQAQIAALEAKSAVKAPAPPDPVPSLVLSPIVAAALASPPAKIAPPPPPAPITVETGGVKLRMSGLFQGWFAATRGGVDTFRLRRTELKFSGDMSSRAKWVVMVDPAKALSIANSTVTIGGQRVVTASSVGQSGRVLQDAFATVIFNPALIVDVGQQKIPLSMEGPQSSGRLDTVERALFMSDKARGGGYGDVRDLGLMVRGKAAAGQLEYYGGVFNGLGESQNDVDKNDEKDLVARAIVRPAFFKGLHLGGSFARDGFGSVPAAGRLRHGVEFQYARFGATVKSELMFGRDGEIRRRGGYVHVMRPIRKNLQAALRFDTWDPDTRADLADSVTEKDWLAGLTYTIANSGAWLQLNFIQKTFGGLLPARSVFMANLQSTW
jgi:hypothetical protein